MSVLRGPWPAEKVIVGKCLKAGCFPYRKAAALGRVMMDVVVPVLGNVTGEGCRWRSGNLYPKPVCEQASGKCLVYIGVFGKQLSREIFERWGFTMLLGIAGTKQITMKILCDMPRVE